MADVHAKRRQDKPEPEAADADPSAAEDEASESSGTEPAVAVADLEGAGALSSSMSPKSGAAKDALEEEAADRRANAEETLTDVAPSEPISAWEIPPPPEETRAEADLEFVPPVEPHESDLTTPPDGSGGPADEVIAAEPSLATDSAASPAAEPVVEIEPSESELMQETAAEGSVATEAGAADDDVEEPVPDEGQRMESGALELPAAQPPDEFRDLLGQAVGLKLEGVTREFGGRREGRVTALSDISMEIGPGEYVSMMGPSGCGKSTLLALMGGLDRPSAGRVFAAGLPLDELPEKDLADYRLQSVSTIFQTFNLIPYMSVQDNVALPLTLAGMPLAERRQRARHLLDLVGLKDRAKTRAGRLSGGEQQRVAVARALAGRPGLILADEPTGNLDSSAGEAVLKLLDDLNARGATVVLVSHDPEVARHAKRVVRMIDGRAVELESGKPTVRSHLPVDPAPRLHWRDTVQVGLSSAGRRPLRTSLTTLGVAIGIAALSLIGALAGGLQEALTSPALATSQVHQVAVYPSADSGASGFDASTLSLLAARPHVKAAWGQIGISGTFSATALSPLSGTPAAVKAPGVLVSLPPLQSTSALPEPLAGRLPLSDVSPEVVLTDSEAVALGFKPAASAVGTQVVFDAMSGALIGGARPVTLHTVLRLLVSGIVSGSQSPASLAGGLLPHDVMSNYWSTLAQANAWKGGEYMNITLLADSGLAVTALRDDVASLGFQTVTFGDQFRNLEDLVGKLRFALVGLALVALLLACLGIANTMYTAVLERTKEIGILKALGARSSDVRLLFVSEAAAIGLAGGLVGALAAVGLGRLGNTAVDRLTQAAGSSGGFAVFRTDLPIVVAAVLVAVVLSMASGILPAMRAARQDPARALRYE